MRSKTAQKVCFPTETVAVTLRVSEGAERSMNASINIIYSWRRELIVITGTSLHFLLYLNLDERIFYLKALDDSKVQTIKIRFFHIDARIDKGIC